jgi:chromosome segregation ATPase
MVADLRKEMAKIVEANVDLSQHAADLEGRLARSEANTNDLVAQLEKHEREAERREAAFKELESHIAVLDTTKDNKLLLEELEAKDRRIADLERAREEATSGLSEEKVRLADAVEAERAVQAELRAQLESLQRSTTSISLSEGLSTQDISRRLPSISHKELTPPDSPSSGRQPTTPDDDEVMQLRAALRQLAARCNDAENRYAEAENRVIDLSSQLSEARLIQSEMDDTVPPSPALLSPGNAEAASEDGSTLQTPRGSSPAISPTTKNVGGGKRSSLPVITGGMKPQDFRKGRGYGETRGVR